MDTSLTSFRKILRKLWLLKPWQSREPLLGHCCPRALPHSICHISYLTPPIEVFLSILESACHKLHIAYGFILLIPSLHGWEAFPTLEALTYTRIIWALSPIAPQIPGVIPGSPYAHGILGIPYGEVCNTMSLTFFHLFWYFAMDVARLRRTVFPNLEFGWTSRFSGV